MIAQRFANRLFQALRAVWAPSVGQMGGLSWRDTRWYAAECMQAGARLGWSGA